MYRRVFFGAIAALSVSVLVARAAPKDDVQAAVAKLADSANYSWTATVEGGFGQAPTATKTEKGGYTVYTNTGFQGALNDIVIKGDKAAIWTDAGWKTAAEILTPPATATAPAPVASTAPATGRGRGTGRGAAGRGGRGGAGGFNPDTFAARGALTFQTPAVLAGDILGKVKALTKVDDAYTADLDADAAKAILSPPVPAIAANAFAAPEVANPKGSVKFWIKDGMLSKLQVHVEGSLTFGGAAAGGNPFDVNRTSTYEIKDVGTTKITVPDEARKLLP